MASKYDWEFMRPIDQSNLISQLASGNQQINAGLAGMNLAASQLDDAYKQRNTNDIMNALFQARTSNDLPAALQAVQGLQERYGRAYDQNAVRQAMDTRGDTLAARDMQGMALQQAQAKQAAMPQLNQLAVDELARRGGINSETLNGLIASGVDISAIANQMAGNAVSDKRDARNYADSRSDRAEDVAFRKQQADRQQQNWQMGFDKSVDDTNWQRGGDIAKDNPAIDGVATDANGNLVTVQSGGINRMQAYGALSGVRGIRNNNPGNIEFYNQKGASMEGKGNRFARFDTPEQGINAMSKQLDLYFTGKSKNVSKPINTIKDIITTWAPPYNKNGKKENDTAAYIDFVSKKMGVSPTANLNLNDPNTKAALMAAMITKENGGNPYTQQQYLDGITGKTGSSSASVGRPVAAKVVNDLVGDYSTRLAKLNTQFQTSGTGAANKTLADGGKTVDTWVNKNTGKDKTWFTSANDLAQMALKDPDFKKLSGTQQSNILDATFAKMNNVRSWEYVSDANLQKFIATESRKATAAPGNNYQKAKDALFEESYQSAVKQFRASGATPPNREAYRQLVDPQAKPVTQPSAPKVAAQPKPTPAPQPKPAAAPAQPKVETAREKFIRERDAERAKNVQAYAKREAEKAAANKVTVQPWQNINIKGAGSTMLIRNGQTNLSQKELQEMFKNFRR